MTYSMPLFTMVSGFWFKKKDFKTICLRFLMPCVIFSIVNFAWGTLFSFEKYVKATFTTYLQLGYAMWYLWALFFYYLITPFLLRHFKLHRLLILSFVAGLLIGFIPYNMAILQASRVICFYPFFLMGIWLKENWQAMNQVRRGNRWLLALMALSVVYMIANYLSPHVVYGTGFVSGFGLHLAGLVKRIFTYGMCVAMCWCVIFGMPNKKYWFTKYGTRTMNVYLLHMLIIFPFSWYLGKYIMHEWYGYVYLVVVVPTMCMVFFSGKVDWIMKKILLLGKIQKS